MRSLEHAIPGFLGFADDLRSRIAAVGEGEIPDEWTPEHVGARLIEAFEILNRSGGRVGPGRFGNGWPAMVQEYADLVDQQARELAEREKQQAMAARPSSDEVSRMNEALRWPMDHLDGMPLTADALMLWTYATATGRDMAGMLHQRKKRAIAMAEDAMERANAPAHHHPETGDLSDTRDPAVLARNALRVQIAREVAADANAALARSPKAKHAEIRMQAHATFRARCRDNHCAAVVIKPIEAMPGRVMARTTFDRHRKIGMAVIAASLRRAGVAVR